MIRRDAARGWTRNSSDEDRAKPTVCGSRLRKAWKSATVLQDSARSKKPDAHSALTQHLYDRFVAKPARLKMYANLAQRYRAISSNDSRATCYSLGEISAIRTLLFSGPACGTRAWTHRERERAIPTSHFIVKKKKPPRKEERRIYEFGKFIVRKY